MRFEISVNASSMLSHEVTAFASFGIASNFPNGEPDQLHGRRITGITFADPSSCFSSACQFAGKSGQSFAG
jgi:hypothetical protein